MMRPSTEMRGRGPLVVAGVLMILVGVARGAGGVILLIHGASAGPRIKAPPIAFAIDGAINGYLLFGRPGGQGTLVNLIAAAAILLMLALGRTALKRGAHRA